MNPEDIGQKKIQQSILDTEQAIEKHIGKSRKLVAYPYGEYDDWIKKWFKQNAFVALGQQSGAVAQFSDFSALPRYPASGQYANEDTLTTKLLSKALPVDFNLLPSPMVNPDQNPPTLLLQLLVESTRSVNCFVGGQALMNMQKLSATDYQITANEPLNRGRSRYNCTMQSEIPGRFYWLSQPWVIE